MISPREQNTEGKKKKFEKLHKSYFDETFGNKKETSLLPIIKLR